MKSVGIHEIAKLARVSIGTVDRALNGRKRISESTRNRVLHIAQRVGYRPNLAARALSTRRAALRVGVCLPRETNPYFDQIRCGILSEARRFDHLGVEVVYRATERLGIQGVERVSKLLNEGVRAIIATPGEPEGLSGVIAEAEARNIRVVCVDSDVPGSARSSAVCVDAEVSGRVAAELMSGLVRPDAQVAITTGMLGLEDHRKKTEGFRDVFAARCPAGEIVAILEDHEDEDEALRKTSALLRERPALAGLYASTGNSLPVCRAINARGLSGKIKLITTELSLQMVPYFEDRTIFASINSRPYVQGQIAMRLIIDHFVQRRPFPQHYFVAPAIAMPSNMHLFREIRGSKSGG